MRVGIIIFLDAKTGVTPAIVGRTTGVVTVGCAGSQRLIATARGHRANRCRRGTRRDCWHGWTTSTFTSNISRQAWATVYLNHPASFLSAKGTGCLPGSDSATKGIAGALSATIHVSAKGLTFRQSIKVFFDHASRDSLTGASGALNRSPTASQRGLGLDNLLGLSGVQNQKQQR